MKFQNLVTKIVFNPDFRSSNIYIYIFYGIFDTFEYDTYMTLIIHLDK